MNRKYYFNRLNGVDVWNVLNWLDEIGYPYEYTLDENGDGELRTGNKHSCGYYSDGYDFDIENYIIVWTYAREWD